MLLALAALLPLLLSLVRAQGKAEGRCCPRTPASEPGCDLGCRVVLDELDFFLTYPIPDTEGSPWHYDEFPGLNFTTRGGVLTTGCCGGTVDTNPYILSYPAGLLGPQLSGLKYFLENETVYPVPAAGQLDVEWEVSARTFGTQDSPFPASLVGANDVRLAAGALFLHDSEHALYFDWLLTNDRIYARYSRDNVDVTSPPGYAAFAYLVPVYDRKPGDFHTVRVAVDGLKKEVRWYIADRLVFAVDRVGLLMPTRRYMTLDLGGTPTLAFPAQVNVGIGAVTLLDNYPACHSSCRDSNCTFPATRTALVNQGGAVSPPQYSPLLGAPSPAQYYDGVGLPQNFLWGQGSTMRLRHLAVWSSTCQFARTRA